jgi:(p)ppGpp synthase/HD superfamily hydrolase
MAEFMRLSGAIRWAAELHDGQFRDGDDALPYITHPIEVLTYLRNIGGVVDEDMLCAAALHDAIEECDVDASAIADRLGARVAKLVVGLTREEPSEEVARSLSPEDLWKLRSQLLLDEIAGMAPEVQTIKLADRLANVRDAKRTKKGWKKDRYLDQTRQILKIIPQGVNKGLWKAVHDEVRD